MIIYIATNKINGKIYIGQTTWDLKDRWYQHCHVSKDRTTYFTNAIKKHGKDNFTIEELCKCSSIEELNQKEEYYIKEYNSLSPNGYNLLLGGNNKTWCEDSKKKMSDRIRGEKHPLYGKTHSEESKQKNRESQLGEKGNFYGKHHAENIKKKISDSHIGKILSISTKEKMRIAKQKIAKRVYGYNPITCEIMYLSTLSSCVNYGFNKTGVWRCCSGFIKSYKGFIFQYVKGDLS